LEVLPDADVTNGVICGILEAEWDAFYKTLSAPQRIVACAFRKSLNKYQFQAQRELKRLKDRAAKVPGEDALEISDAVQAQLNAEYAKIEAGHDSIAVKQKKKAQAALMLLIDPAEFVLGLRCNIRKGGPDAISLYANLNGLVHEARKPQADAPLPLNVQFTSDMPSEK
jgi:hypothetical protein